MYISDKLIIQVSISRYKAQVGFIPRFLFWLGFSSYFDKPVRDLIALEQSDSEINSSTIHELVERYKNNSDFSRATQDILEHLQNLYPLLTADTLPEHQQQTLLKIKSLSELALSEHQSQQSFFSRWFGSADDETTFLTRIISCITALFSQDIKTRTTADLTTAIENSEPKLTSNPWITDIKALITQLDTTPETLTKTDEKQVPRSEPEASPKPPVAPPAPMVKAQQNTTPLKRQKAAEQHMEAPSYPAPQPPVSEKTPVTVDVKEQKKPVSVPEAPVPTAQQPRRKKETDAPIPPARPLPTLPITDTKHSETPVVTKSAPAIPQRQTPEAPLEKKPEPSSAVKKPSPVPRPELIKEFKDICTEVTRYEKKTVECLEKAKKLQAEVKTPSSETAASEEAKKQDKGGRFFPKPKVISVFTDKAKDLKLKAQRKLLFKQTRYKAALNTVTKLQNSEFTLITQALLVFLKIEDDAFFKENSDRILALCRKARILSILIDISPEIKTDLEQLIDACQGKLNVGQADKTQAAETENIPNAPAAPVVRHTANNSDKTQSDSIQQKAVPEDKQALLLAIIQGTKLKPTVPNKPYSSTDEVLARFEKSQLFQRQVSENDELEESLDLQSEEEWLADSESDTQVELGSFMKPYAPIVETPVIPSQEQPEKKGKPVLKKEIIEEPVNVEDLHKRLELIRLAYTHDFEPEEKAHHIFSF